MVDEQDLGARSDSADTSQADTDSEKAQRKKRGSGKKPDAASATLRAADPGTDSGDEADTTIPMEAAPPPDAEPAAADAEPKTKHDAKPETKAEAATAEAKASSPRSRFRYERRVSPRRR